MKTLKLLILLLGVSLQVSATGYSHNMVAAQKMLKAKKAASAKAAAPKAPLVLESRSAVIKPKMALTDTSHEATVLKPEAKAVSFTQHVAGWIVRVVCVEGTVLEERWMSLFSAESNLEENLPEDATFLSLAGNTISYLITTARSIW